MRKRMLSRMSRASWRRDNCPALYDARAKWKAELPSINVLSKSKNAAPRGCSATVDFDDDRVALATAGANRRHAEASAATPQLVHQGAEDACARCTDRVTQRNRSAVHVHLRVIDAEHPYRVERNRGER